MRARIVRADVADWLWFRWRLVTFRRTADVLRARVEEQDEIITRLACELARAARVLDGAGLLGEPAPGPRPKLHLV